MEKAASKNAIFRLIAFVTGLILLCILVSVLTVKLLMAPDEPPAVTEHEWLHQELNLSGSEEAALHTIEEAYRSRKSELERNFEAAKLTVAEVLLQNNSYSPEVDTAVRELHEIHGDLQQLSIEHYYEMLRNLPPEKQEKLKAIATDALSTPH